MISRRRFVGTSGWIAAGMAARSLGALAAGMPAGEATVVKTRSGELRGETVDGVRVFRGVPFAEPPVGDLRFRPPAEVKPWTGVRPAIKFAPEAMQPAEAGIARSEDCLYLNVWAPEGKEPFPVFVWIHGGGYTGGRATAPIFDGAGFARDGVVLVTVAYRLGVFGFMDLGPVLGAAYAGSGNNAMRDLVAALRWVQGNIAAFGGDPGRVTVGGESAGAKATAGLMAIPEAQGLFGSMISESGGGERILSLADAGEVAREFAAEWGSGGAALRTAGAEALIDTQTRMIRGSKRHFPFRSEVDGQYLKGRPVDLVAKGSSRGKRLLIGTNRDESALFLGPHPKEDPKQSDLGNLPLDRFNAVFARYAGLYPEMPPSQRRVRAVTAEEYWVPSVRLADGHVGAGGKAWMYRLDFMKKTGKMAGEAYHSEDLSLVWEKPDRTEAEDAAAEALGEQIHAAWVAFIKGGEPAAGGLPRWPEYRAGDRKTMVLDRSCRVEERPMEAELRLWDGVL